MLNPESMQNDKDLFLIEVEKLNKVVAVYRAAKKFVYSLSDETKVTMNEFKSFCKLVNAIKKVDVNEDN